jgi:membrane protein implicated in regulation of membrane protease activity
MVLRRIKYALDELWGRITEFFVLIGFLLIFAACVLFVLSPIIVPFAVGYAVFVVVTSPVNSTVKVITFAAYSFGLFVYGTYLEGYRWREKVKEVKASLDECERKVLSIMDVRRCLDGRRSRRCADAKASVESKVYDAVRCIETVKEKL